VAEEEDKLASQIMEAFPYLVDIVNLYLEYPDLPADMKPQILNKQFQPLKDEELFHRLGGIHSGVTQYVTTDVSKPPQLFNFFNDTRWVFPTEDLAKKYHQDKLAMHSEGAEDITKSLSPSALVGKDCHIFSSPNPKMTNFFYLFQVKNVVVKMYVARFDRQHREFKLGDATGIAQKAAQRAEACSSHIQTQ